MTASNLLATAQVSHSIEYSSGTGPSTNAIARLLATDMQEDLLAIMREIFARNAFAERLAYSPDTAAVVRDYEVVGTGQAVIG